MNNANQQLCNDVSKSIIATLELMTKSGHKLALRNNIAVATLSAQNFFSAGTAWSNSKNGLPSPIERLTTGSSPWLQGFQYWMGICEDVKSTMTEAVKLAQNTSAEMQIHMKEALQPSLFMGPESAFNGFPISMNGAIPSIEKMWALMVDAHFHGVPIDEPAKTAV